MYRQAGWVGFNEGGRMGGEQHIEPLAPVPQRQRVFDQERRCQAPLRCLSLRPLDRHVEKVDARDLAALPSEVSFHAQRDKKTRQGVRALRPTRPAGPQLHLAEPPEDGPTRDDHLDFAPWHTPQESPCGFWQGKVLAKRKPLLLFRFAGTLLLRLAERTFDA